MLNLWSIAFLKFCSVNFQETKTFVTESIFNKVASSYFTASQMFNVEIFWNFDTSVQDNIFYFFIRIFQIAMISLLKNCGFNLFFRKKFISAL